MMLKNVILAFAIISVIFAGNSFGQQHFTNKWSVYTSMKDINGVGIYGSGVWAASSGGLFTFDYNNPGGQVRKFTVLDGLLSDELTSNTIDNSGNVWCGGIDGSVSVYNPSNNSWRVITDIQISSETSKSINDLFQYGNSMFISNQFSLIQFNIPQFQFIDQPYISLGSLPAKTPVYQTIAINDTVWAATKNGIAYANINSALPIQSNWRNFTTSNPALKSNQINSVIYFAGKIVFGTDSGMAYFQNGSLNAFYPLYNGNPLSSGINKMAVSGNSLYFTTYKYSNDLYRVDNSNLKTAIQILSGTPINVLKVNSAGDLIIGTANRGINIYRNNTSTYVVPNGPNSNSFQSLEVDFNSNIYGCSGGTGEGIFRLNGTTWRNFTTDNTPPQSIGSGDYRHIYASRYSNTVYAGGYGNGMVKIAGDSLYRFDNSNSCLVSFSGNFVLVEGMREDNNGQLWVINRAAPNPFLQFNEPPNKCFAFPTPSNASATTMLFLDIDRYNTKWASLPNDVEGSPRGVVYFNEATKPTGAIIGTDYLGLGQPVIAVYDLVVEKNGEVWIATDNGISIVRDPYQVVSNPGSLPQIDKMRIIEDGLSTPLLENVQCIGVDALNNKWLGTLSNGLIYVSSDGSTLLARYNTSNSPLPDNKITCIVIDPKTGIAYFGTGKGMASLQTIAVQPLDNCDKIKVGPSPFIIPSTNPLRIDGLVAESTVKILTLSGTLVYEFVTEGGRITNWDGRDTNGNLVSSGIYIVAGYNKDATQVCTGKIAVVRK